MLTFGQIAPTCCSRVLRRKFKEVQSWQSSIAIIFQTITLRCRTLFSMALAFPYFAFFLVLFLRTCWISSALTSYTKQGRGTVHRDSLVLVQRLRPLSEIPTHSEMEREIRNWTIATSYYRQQIAQNFAILYRKIVNKIQSSTSTRTRNIVNRC